MHDNSEPNLVETLISTAPASREQRSASAASNLPAPCLDKPWLANIAHTHNPLLEPTANAPLLGIAPVFADPSTVAPPAFESAASPIPVDEPATPASQRLTTTPPS